MSLPKTRMARGKALENWISDRIMEKGLGIASKSPGSGSGNREKADIINSIIIYERETGEKRGLGIEAKNHKTPHIKKWWEQTQKLEVGDLNRIPVLVYKLGGEKYFETKTVIYLETFLDLVKDNCELSGSLKQLGEQIDKSESWKGKSMENKLNNCLNMIDIGRKNLMRNGKAESIEQWNEYDMINGNEYLKRAKTIIKDCLKLIEE